jgi:phage terminase large subunit-like protein
MQRRHGTRLTDAPKRSRGRPRKYATPQEAKAAHRAQDAQRAKVTRVLAPEEADAILRDQARGEALIAAAQQRAAARRKWRQPTEDEIAVADGGAPPPKTIKAQRLDADLKALAARGYPNVASAFQYVRDVLARRILACRMVILACERHERDWARIDSKGWPYTFDFNKAERACKALQLFREIKGPRARRLLVLMPWQRFMVASAFGWVHAVQRTRRFRYVLCFVPRGNGKTTMAAPWALYMLALDDEGGAEVYAAAVTRQQARLVFDTAQRMAERAPEFRQRFGIEVTAHAIVQNESASMFRPLSRDASSLDGLNVHFAVLDELAQHKNGEVFDVLQTATGKRTQSMMLGITTAASNQSSIGYEQWQYAQRVLERKIDDEQFFALIYTTDKDDDWREKKTWIKANPNWDVSVMPEVIANLCLQAQQSASRQNAFKQKHLNLWTSTAVLWMNMQVWDHCGDASLRIEDFADEECIVGLDLATKVDLAAKAKWFRREIDGVLHYYLFADFFLPEGSVARNDAYSGWVADGWIHVTPGDANDLVMIEASVIDDNKAHRVIDAAYDPWQSRMMATNLENAGVSVIEYRPTVGNFSPPMKEIEALALQGRLHHNGNPVLAWNVGCVMVQEDMKGNIFPRKNKDDPLVKIDGLVAALMGLGRWMFLDASEITPSITLLTTGLPASSVPAHAG